MRKNPVFHFSTFLRVPSGVRPIITPFSFSANRATLSTIILGFLRSVGIPPNHSINHVMPGLKILCLAIQRILKLRPKKDAIASTKSQLDVCGAPITIKRFKSGIVPLTRHPNISRTVRPSHREKALRVPRRCTGTCSWDTVVGFVVITNLGLASH